VIQSYLRDRASDLDRVVAGGSRVRLVKGGYWEPAAAHRNKEDIDRCFDRDIELLFSRGRFPAIATHDEQFILRTKAIAGDAGVDPSGFEFQMLYGVRQDLQQQLVREGYNVRCYVPYGTEWFAYFLGSVRRLPMGMLRRWQTRFGRDRKTPLQPESPPTVGELGE
jgi:proline dehydrogenase